MGIRSWSSIFVLLSLFGIGQSYIEYDGWINVELLHSLNADKPETFTYRANISIPSLNTGLSNIVQNPMSSEDLKNLKDLAANNGFYRLKANVEYPNGLRRTFTTANKACGLLSVLLNDELWIAIDGNGYVNGITSTLSASGDEIYDCSSYDFSTFTISEFSTDILIKHTELAPVPDTASFIQKIEREREARDRGEVKDNRGFFGKYWIYIVPVVILLFVSGATNPDQQQK
ncbi:ER membrane protein complex subunit 10 [Stomoxys calcitrans]|uniref:ER membrane protein complex subunit 10 n=1 Tax=Stomoxys calcitrans TaxID=35570 RepID=UPI0027E35DB1|nr:ER membrane protein complex subunit 10 [Stomoxys calcitrans]